MHKHGESRSDNSADNHRSGKNPHLSDEQLLLALDGELSSRKTAWVEAHIEACWSCRARSQQIEEAIADVVEHRDCLTKPYFPLSDGGRESFVVQLEQLARAVGRPSLLSRILGQLRVLSAFSQSTPRHAWISALVLASCALFFFTRLWEVPKVSASQLLEESRVFELRQLHSVAKPVVYQKLRIRIGTKAVTRTIYRDPVGMRQSDRLDATGGGGELASNVGLPGQPQDHSDTLQTAEAELQRTFLTARMNWQDPLSPATYSAWHESLAEKQDEITADGHDFLILRTTTSEGHITEARITVRATDFHPVAESLHLRDNREVEVKEMAWEVLPMEAVNPAIFSLGPTLPVEVARPVNLLSVPQAPTDAQLAEAELQARVAMHVARADLGEQIELRRNAPDFASRFDKRSVIVQGIVSTSERKNDLLAILRGISHVELRLQTVEEAAVQQNQLTADKSEDTTPLIAREAGTRENRVPGESVDASGHGTAAVVVRGRTAFEAQLEEHYPNAADRAEFINGAVELVQDAVEQAWALRRLRDRYTPDTVAELSRGSQQTLDLLIHDHVSVLRQRLDEARNMISPLFPSEPVEEVPQLPEAPLPAAVPADDWRSATTEIFLETQRVCNNVVALLAGADEGASETQALVRDLQITLAKLQTQLPMLYQHVMIGPILSEPSNSYK